MLVLRRAFVERTLRDHGIETRLWTLDALRRHYAPVGGHTFDPIRTLMAELQELAFAEQMLMKHALFIASGDGSELGDPEAAAASVSASSSARRSRSLFNVKAIDTRLKLAHERAALTKQLQQALSSPDAVETSTIMQCVAELSRLLGGGGGGASEPRVLALEQRYEIGERSDQLF